MQIVRQTKGGGTIYKLHKLNTTDLFCTSVGKDINEKLYIVLVTNSGSLRHAITCSFEGGKLV